MEILSIIFANLIFAVTFNLYYRIIHGKTSFSGKNEIMQFVKPTLIFALIMTPISIIFHYLALHYQNTGTVDEMVAFGIGRTCMVFAWFNVVLMRVDKEFYESSKMEAVFIVYVLSIAVWFASFFIVSEILSFWMPNNLSTVFIFDGIISIPIHFGIYQAIKRAGTLATAEVKEKKAWKVALPVGIGVLFIFAMLRDFAIDNFWLSLGFAVVMIGFGFVFARQLKKGYVKVATV